MDSVTETPPIVQDDAAILQVQLLRSKYAELVADALYKAFRLSPHAELKSAPPHENTAHFRQLAEGAVMLAVDGELREASHYFAADQRQGQLGLPPLAELTPGHRVNRARDEAEIDNARLRFLRGFYPSAIDSYRQMVRADRAGMTAARAARRPYECGASLAESIRQGLLASYAVIRGGKDGR